MRWLVPYVPKSEILFVVKVVLEVERGGGGVERKLLKFPNRSPHIPELRFMHSICGCYQLSFCLSAGRISGLRTVRISVAAFTELSAVSCLMAR
jgi:hypothetical protein